MRRLAIPLRCNLAERARELGFVYHSIDGLPYWDESAYYAFTLQQIERDLEDPAAELHLLCLELVDRAVKDEQMLRRLAIPEHAWDLIAASWKRRDPALYGRFDFAYDGAGPAKLLEYNADTPTALYEAAVFQWIWLEDCIENGTLPAGADQFNSLHEALCGRFGEIQRQVKSAKRLVLSCVLEHTEDAGLVGYLAKCAKTAGYKISILSIDGVGARAKGHLLDQSGKPIELLFKLYPWEWMLTEPFGQGLAARPTRFIEPPWKTILSNKGILPLLWKMAPGHPNLLAAYFEDEPDCVNAGATFARKPFHSREGSNVAIVDGGRTVDSDTGPYGGGPFIRQKLGPVRAFDGNFPVIGAWIIGDKACGIGIREDRSIITKNTSRFVPHAIVG